MNEMQVLDIIAREFRSMNLPLPEGLDTRTHRNEQARAAWSRAAHRIVYECSSDCRQAARTASIAGSMITRGKTRL
jgi:hypothetical protein